MRAGRLHSPRRRAPVNARLAQAWRRAAAHGVAFATLLAVLLAPLNLCCVKHPVAFEAARLEAALGHGAQAILCAHAGGHGDEAPAPASQDHCPGCHLVNGAALIPPATTAALAYPNAAIEILAPPESLGFRVAAAILAARPRGPPSLI